MTILEPETDDLLINSEIDHLLACDDPDCPGCPNDHISLCGIVLTREGNGGQLCIVCEFLENGI